VGHYDQVGIQSGCDYNSRGLKGGCHCLTVAWQVAGDLKVVVSIPGLKTLTTKNVTIR